MKKSLLLIPITGVLLAFLSVFLLNHSSFAATNFVGLYPDACTARVADHPGKPNFSQAMINAIPSDKASHSYFINFWAYDADWNLFVGESSSDFVTAAHLNGTGTSIGTWSSQSIQRYVWNDSTQSWTFEATMHETTMWPLSSIGNCVPAGHDVNGTYLSSVWSGATDSDYFWENTPPPLQIDYRMNFKLTGTGTDFKATVEPSSICVFGITDQCKGNNVSEGGSDLSDIPEPSFVTWFLRDNDLVQSPDELTSNFGHADNPSSVCNYLTDTMSFDLATALSDCSKLSGKTLNSAHHYSLYAYPQLYGVITSVDPNIYNSAPQYNIQRYWTGLSFSGSSGFYSFNTTSNSYNAASNSYDDSTVKTSLDNCLADHSWSTDFGGALMCMVQWIFVPDPVVLNQTLTDMTTDTHGLTSIITAPLTLIGQMTSATCSSISLPLPYLNNKNLTLPCMGPIYSTYFSQFSVLYQLITTGFICYWVIVNFLNRVKGFKDPDKDRIEVLDL